jgi:WS/DGAT C-terminal domain
VLPLIANEPLGVGALSYAGTFTIGVVADRDAFPDIEVFAAGAREELRALGVSTYPTSGRPGADALGARPTRDGRPAVERGDDAPVAQAARHIRRELVTHDNAQC